MYFKISVCMKKIFYTSILATLFFGCGPSAEELEQHEKKVESETIKLDDDFEKELEGMAAEAGDTLAADSIQK